MKKYLLSFFVVLISILYAQAQDSLYLSQGTFFVNQDVENVESEGDLLFTRYPYLYTRESNAGTDAYSYNVYRTDEIPFDYAPNWVGDINFTPTGEPEAELLRFIRVGDSTIVAMYFKQTDGSERQQFGRFFYADTPTDDRPHAGAIFLESDEYIDLDVNPFNFIHVTSSGIGPVMIERTNADILIKKIGSVSEEDNILSKVIESNEEELETDAPIKGMLFSEIIPENIVSISEGRIVVAQGNVMATIDISDPFKPTIVAQKDMDFTVSELRSRGEALYVLSRGCCSQPTLYQINPTTLDVLASGELGTSELVSIASSGKIYAVRLGSTSIDAYRYRVDIATEGENEYEIVLDAKGTNLTTENFGFPTGKGLLSGGSLTAGIIFDRGDSFPAGYINLSILTAGETSTSNEKIDSDGISGFELSQNYPNPFNPSTSISFEIPEISNVKVEVLDLLGRKVATLVDQKLNSGSHSVTFNASGLSSGIYIYRIEAGSYSRTMKMTLLK